eukprot:CAMPEP_0184438896 /NCGR_PEP_ID=MMETSP0738-20130409/680745_1 /TAXON_ID=385413 /ORGANISM="Thalassiosira miniscula, Strain CCMP1093" /LENGTH=49 /DNA_ID=CAMNT_0026806393 /DNA_START=222 /DNA_END=371 /DNA_ORIENTATION=-
MGLVAEAEVVELERVRWGLLREETETLEDEAAWSVEVVAGLERDWYDAE